MFDGLVELCWPHVCPLCACEVRRGGHVHPRCLVELPRVRALPDRGIVACFEDGPQWFRLLHQWKYGGERGLAAIVADCMVGETCGFPDDAVLVPVPDDPQRYLERGFSPVTDLARELARRAGLRFDSRLLVRARANVSQTSCVDDLARRANILGAFRAGELSRWPRDRMLVLVEDQVTSGATVFEAARILSARGAPIRVWCAARAARAPGQLDGHGGRN